VAIFGFMDMLGFHFFSAIEGMPVVPRLRVSVWLEGDTYLVPCEFVEVATDGGAYRITVMPIEIDYFLKPELIGKRFLFGNPGKIIGHGTLTELFSN
jgi:hypothetical protein